MGSYGTGFGIFRDGSTGGAGGTYNGASPTTTTVGSLPSGTNILGMSFQDIFQNMLVADASFGSFSIQAQSQSLEVGDTVSGVKTFAWTINNAGDLVPNTIAIRDVTNAVDLATGLANDGSEALNVGNIMNIAPAVHSWQARATNSNGLFNSGLFSINWFWRMYYGTSANATLTEAQIEALINNPLASTKNGTFAFAALNYKYVCYPDSFGSPTASTGFRDSSTLLPIDMATVADDAFYSNVQNGWSYGLVSVTNSFGQVTNYRVYRTKNTLGGSINIIVS